MDHCIQHISNSCVRNASCSSCSTHAQLWSKKYVLVVTGRQGEQQLLVHRRYEFKHMICNSSCCLNQLMAPVTAFVHLVRQGPPRLYTVQYSSSHFLCSNLYMLECRIEHQSACRSYSPSKKALSLDSCKALCWQYNPLLKLIRSSLMGCTVQSLAVDNKWNLRSKTANAEKRTWCDGPLLAWMAAAVYEQQCRLCPAL